MISDCASFKAYTVCVSVIRECSQFMISAQWKWRKNWASGTYCVTSDSLMFFFLAPSVPSAYICSLEYYWTYIWYIALASMHKFTVDTPVIKLQTWHFQMNLCGKIRILHVYFKHKVCYDYWGELVLLKKISTKFAKPTAPELPVRHYHRGLSSGFSSIDCY